MALVRQALATVVPPEAAQLEVAAEVEEAVQQEAAEPPKAPLVEQAVEEEPREVWEEQLAVQRMVVVAEEEVEGVLHVGDGARPRVAGAEEVAAEWTCGTLWFLVSSSRMSADNSTARE